MDRCGHAFVDLVSVPYAPAAVTSHSAIGEISLATELHGTIGSAWRPSVSKAKRLLFSLKVRLVNKKLLMSNEARLRLAAVTDEAQKSFCQNTLLKIALSDPETQKTKHLESPGARASQA